MPSVSLSMSHPPSPQKEKIRFFVTQLLKGFLYFAILVGIFFLVQKALPEAQRAALFGKIYDNPALVLTVYALSEIFFGIIPPEVFMLWSFRTGYLGPYFFSVGIMGIASYAIGFFNFKIGQLINHRTKLAQSQHRLVRKYLDLFGKYGAFMVVVAALTPVPFSAISLLSGSGGVGQKKYLLYSLTRILRYFIYGYILWMVER